MRNALTTCELISRKLISRKDTGTDMKGDGGIGGEGKLVGIPKFYFWSKCTMPFGCSTVPLAYVLTSLLVLQDLKKH